MKKYLVTAMANNVVFEQTLYAKSEGYVHSHIGENIMLLNVKIHPVKDGFFINLLHNIYNPVPKRWRIF